MKTIPERAETLLLKLESLGYSRAADAIRSVWLTENAEQFFSELLSYVPQKELIQVDGEFEGIIKNKEGFTSDAFFTINEISDIHDAEEEAFKKATLTSLQRKRIKDSKDIWKEAYVPRKKR